MENRAGKCPRLRLLTKEDEVIDTLRLRLNREGGCRGQPAKLGFFALNADANVRS